MNYEELLEIKKEVDELSLYYRALKKRSEEIDEKFYSNNLLDLDDDKEVVTEDTIDDKIRKGRSSYTLRKVIGYCVRYLSIMMANIMLDIPKGLYFFLILANLAYYGVVLLGYEKIARIKLELKMDDGKIDLEALAQEKKDVERRLEYVRDKFTHLSAKYEKLVAKLDENEYREYLDYISEYLQFMLEHSNGVLKEASDACLLPDYNMEMDSVMGIEDKDENDDVHKYRLN